MDVSRGFSAKIENWVGNDFSYKPFECNNNPYKSRFMLVNSSALPKLLIDDEILPFFVNALVDEQLLEDVFYEAIEALPKEYKGAKKLASWLLQNCGQHAIMSSINALMTDDAAQLKAAEKQQPEQFARGQQIFKEVLQEFAKVDVILLHGSYAVEQFKKQFEQQLELTNPSLKSIKDLEEAGHFAKLTLDAREIQVYACRSLSTFTKNSAQFETLRQHLQSAFNG